MNFSLILLGLVVNASSDNGHHYASDSVEPSAKSPVKQYYLPPSEYQINFQEDHPPYPPPIVHHGFVDESSSHSSETEMDSSDAPPSFREKHHGNNHHHRRHRHGCPFPALVVLFFAGWGVFSAIRKFRAHKCEHHAHARTPAVRAPGYYPPQMGTPEYAPVNQEVQYVE